MKKIILLILVAGFIIAAIAAWLILGSATAFKENRKYLLVYTGKADEVAVMDTIQKNNFLKNPGVFNFLANKMDVWKKLKPGRYEIKKGENLLSITRMLRNNRQSPVNLVINKLRTNEDIASIMSKNFEADSAEVIDFINNKDSLAKLNVNNLYANVTYYSKHLHFFLEHYDWPCFQKIEKRAGNFLEEKGPFKQG